MGDQKNGSGGRWKQGQGIGPRDNLHERESRRRELTKASVEEASFVDLGEHVGSEKVGAVGEQLRVDGMAPGTQGGLDCEESVMELFGQDQGIGLEVRIGELGNLGEQFGEVHQMPAAASAAR
jgi:hypothetical protein